MAFDMSGDNLRICGYDAEAILNQLSELQEERDRLKIDRDEKEEELQSWKDEHDQILLDCGDRLKELQEENERLKAVIDGLSNKSEMSEAVDPDGYVTAAAKILHALSLQIGTHVNEFAMPVIAQIIKNNVSQQIDTLKAKVSELEAKPCAFCGCSLENHREDLTCPNFAFGEMRGWLDHKFMAS